MARPDIRKKLAALLKRRGYALTDAVGDALDDFARTVDEENDELAAEGDEGDDGKDDDAEPDDLAPTRSIDCPHCGERIAIVLDLSGEDQDTVQDCEVCCSPIRISYTVEHGRLGDFSAEAS